MASENLTENAMFSPEDYEVVWHPISGDAKNVDFNNFTALVGIGEGTTNTYQTTYGKFTITTANGTWDKFTAEVPPQAAEYKYWMEQSGSYGSRTSPISGYLEIKPKAGVVSDSIFYTGKFMTVATTTLTVGSATGMQLSWQVDGLLSGAPA